MTHIREENPGDLAAIRNVTRCTFGQDLEANIVDGLRSNGAALLSLVAIQDRRVVGHIMYSPISVGGNSTGAALGPMAVLPELQRQGIGSRLIQTGSRMLQAAGYPFVIVLGHADYYPRFGFKPASTYGVQCEWDVPDEAFMLLVLDESKVRDVTGLAKYRPEFSSTI